MLINIKKDDAKILIQQQLEENHYVHDLELCIPQDF